MRVATQLKLKKKLFCVIILPLFERNAIPLLDAFSFKV